MHRAATSAADVSNLALNEEELALSLQLYYMMMMLCKGTALSTVQNAGQGQGLTAWRQLAKDGDPHTATQRTPGSCS